MRSVGKFELNGQVAMQIPQSVPKVSHLAKHCSWLICQRFTPWISLGSPAGMACAWQVLTHFSQIRQKGSTLKAEGMSVSKGRLVVTAPKRRREP